ncbi:PhzF family phenazine biosynthesis protein [Haloarculaceae archaeon H-GB2-1]|nr:PhzF family phenazine biosynthesis protein [Haloarculaceae archaeon H-GB1-1]MEA5387644.1 PhzF family phenazine biosynthesis protein [Haloarculaceae archaeon H-GB11]MEA5409131.1 PhzF family phenazine biosynthesis protein [Haloarculaceae archaeon H-GB2-1]
MSTDDRTIAAYLVDAFTDDPLAGNPAGVVPDADDLTDEQRQQIANELGASETAFVSTADEAEFRLSYFTPETEVDLCGHATVATFAHLFDRGDLETGAHTVETNTGTLAFSVDEDGTVWLTPNRPEIRPAECTHERVADALGVDVASLRDVGADLPLSTGDAGASFLLVPVNYFEHLRDASPDMGAIADLSEDLDVDGVYAFTFDTLDAEATLHGRAFAPRDGVPEDPVTGTASAAVSEYLVREGALDADIEEVVCEQGHFLDRPGRVRVDVSGEVRIGGRAVTVLDGSLLVPEDSDDDIIEV